jgi:hypothetical protein
MIERIPARALIPGAPASPPGPRFFQRHRDDPSVVSQSSAMWD